MEITLTETELHQVSYLHQYVTHIK